MKINSERISAKLHELPIEEVSFLTGFQIRHGGKINGFDFVISFFLMILNGFNTVEKWAAGVSKLSGNLISTQSLQGKLQFRHQRFAEALLGHVLRHQIQRSEAIHMPVDLFKSFRRVYLEDSTCVKLPPSLAEFFPGNFNHKGKGATARIQLRLELFSGEYTYFELQSYRDNDQKFAYHITGQLLPGDLVIRDLGYGVLGAFQIIMGMGAFFLSRYCFGINVYDPKTGEEIDLLKKLRSLRNKGGNILDTEILLGKEAKLPVRLVAIKAPPQVEQSRKRKAEKDRNKKANHGKEYMEFLGWTIMVTNVGAEVWTPEQMLQAYGCRWHIEIVFKCWKSKFDFALLFDNKHSMTPARAVISFYLLLIWLTLFFAKWFNYFLHAVLIKKQKWVSPLKFADFVKEHFVELLGAEDLDAYLDFVARYYTYDKRKGKPNMMEKIYLLILT